MRVKSLISSKIYFGKIISGHMSTLTGYGQTIGSVKKKSLTDILTFFIYPLVISGIIFALGLRLNDAKVDMICTALSIFVGLLFNVTVLLITLKRKIKPTVHKAKEDNNEFDPDEQFNKVIEQTHYNISFSIIVSIGAIITAFISIVKYHYIGLVFTYITIYLCFVFLFTLIMSIKRMFQLLETDLKKKPETSSNGNGNHTKAI